MPIPECNGEYPLRVTSDLVPGAEDTPDETVEEPQSPAAAPRRIRARQ